MTVNGQWSQAPAAGLSGLILPKQKMMDTSSLARFKVLQSEVDGQQSWKARKSHEAVEAELHARGTLLIG
jgi:hypothetical protein